MCSPYLLPHVLSVFQTRDGNHLVAVRCGRIRDQLSCWGGGSGANPLPLLNQCFSTYYPFSPRGSLPFCPWIFLPLPLAEYSITTECSQEEAMLSLGHSRVRSLFPGGGWGIPNHLPPWPLGAEVKGSWGWAWSWFKPREAHWQEAGQVSPPQDAGRPPILWKWGCAWVSPMYLCAWWPGSCEPADFSWFGFFLNCIKTFAWLGCRFNFRSGWRVSDSRVCWLPAQSDCWGLLKGEILKGECRVSLKCFREHLISDPFTIRWSPGVIVSSERCQDIFSSGSAPLKTISHRPLRMKHNSTLDPPSSRLWGLVGLLNNES